MAKDTGNWSEQFLRGVLLEKLVAAARLWYQNNADKWTGFEDWKKRFRKKFIREEDRIVMLESFLNSYQQRGESSEMFVARTERLGKRLEMTTSDVKGQVLKGLAVEYVRAAPFLVKRDHEDTDDLIHDIRDMTCAIKETQRGNEETMNRRNFQGRVLLCFSCGLEGHKSAQCLSRDRRQGASGSSEWGNSLGANTSSFNRSTAVSDQKGRAARRAWRHRQPHRVVNRRVPR